MEVGFHPGVLRSEQLFDRPYRNDPSVGEGVLDRAGPEHDMQTGLTHEQVLPLTPSHPDGRRQPASVSATDATLVPENKQ